MNYRIMRTIIDLTAPSLQPTPTHTVTPTLTPTAPPTQVLLIPSTTSGNGLIITLLVIVSLALAGGIVWALWMFRTQRWVSARSLKINRARSQSASTQEYGRRYGSQQAYRPYQERSGSLVQQNVTPNRLADEATARDQTKSSLRPRPEDPLKNKPWLDLAEECVKLYDELDGLFPSSDPRREAATHVMRRLQGILARAGVETISHDRTYDIHRHLVVPPDLEVSPGTPIARTVSPGFAIGSRVIRPAQVQVASSGHENMEERT